MKSRIRSKRHTSYAERFACVPTCVLFAGKQMSEQAQNPLYFLTIWYRPANTMREVIASGKGHGLAVAIAAIFGMLQMARPFVAMEAESFGPFALVGAVGGVFALYFVSMLARNFARWFGGSAELKVVRTAFGLSLLPWTMLWTILFVVLMSGEAPANAEQIYPIFIGLFIYGYVIMLLALSTALNLSALRAFGCLVLSAVVAFFILNMLAVVVMSMLGIQPPVAPAP